MIGTSMGRLATPLLLSLLVACPQAQDPVDAGLPSPEDAGAQGPVDAGTRPADTGAAQGDTGAAPVQDAGTLAPADAGAVTDAGPDCEGHAIGDSWPHEDGCNTCSCTENGIMCTLIHCPDQGCGDHQPGDSWEAGDGCNTCTCTDDRRVRCTAMACQDDCGGREIGDSWPHEDGCNTCSCTENGIICTRRGCPPAEPDFTRCESPVECIITKNTCCGVCGAPDLEDLQGVNSAHVQDLDAHLCGEPRPDCPECVMMPPRGNYIAICERAQCLVVDHHQSFTYDRCRADHDCQIAANRCCTPCNQPYTAFNATAVSTDANLQLRRRLCAGATCEPCNDPRPAPTVEAYCENNRCRVRTLR